MGTRLDHLIIPARDGELAARWFAELFGLDEPVPFSVFWQASLDDLDLDFDTWGDEPFTTGHYAFLVSEDDFDEIFGRLHTHAIEYWADPGRREAGSINHHDGGRGVYFASPDGHLLEIITRRYGS